MIFVLLGFSAGMAQLSSVAIFLTTFCVSSTNVTEGPVVLGSAKSEIMSVTD